MRGSLTSARRSRSRMPVSISSRPSGITRFVQSLGAALLKAGRTAEAEAVYREDLKRFPENGWSLFGLAAALRAQGKSAEAAAVDQRFSKAWSAADVKLTASRF